MCDGFPAKQLYPDLSTGGDYLEKTIKMISLFNFSLHYEKSRSLLALTILPCDPRQRNLSGEGVSLRDKGFVDNIPAGKRKNGEVNRWSIRIIPALSISLYFLLFLTLLI